MRRYKRKPRNLFYFWIVVKAVRSHCFFSIREREVTSVPIITGDMQAMTGVSEMAREIMSACESAMAIMNCDDTESGGHDAACGLRRHVLLQSLELAGQRRGDKQGGEPAPEIRIDPVASVPHKARGLCVLL